MRKNSLISISKMAWMLLISIAIVASACKKDDDDDPPPVVILDGTYIVGAGTALTDFDSKGMMKITRNEVVQEDRAGLMEIYIAVQGGNDGFNIIKVDEVPKLPMVLQLTLQKLKKVPLTSQKLHSGAVVSRKLKLNLQFLLMDFTT
jgi:hypothetical protein